MSGRLPGLLLSALCVVLSPACIAVEDPAGRVEAQPIEPFKQQPAYAWTGKELLLWDGENGYALDPEKNAWRTMARHPAAAALPSPPKLKQLDDGQVLAAFWGTGREASLHLDSYRPDTDSWRRVAAVSGERFGEARGSCCISGIVVVSQEPVVFFWPQMLAGDSESAAVGARLRQDGSVGFVLGGTDRCVWWDHVYAYGGKVWCPTTFSWRLWDAGTGTWGEPAAVEAPFSVRWSFSHCSTGEEIYIFGGDGGFAVPVYLGDLVVYSFEKNEMRALRSTGAPTPRLGASMCWTGKEVVVWGGLHRIPTNGEIDASTGTRQRDGGVTNTGGAYDPATAKWTALPTENAPSPRFDAACVWTGKEVLIWGGYDRKEGHNTQLCSGGAYDPEKKTWRELPSLAEYVEKTEAERRN